MKVMNTSKTQPNQKDLAQTPPWFIESLCGLLGLYKFELDVCAQESTKKAERCYSLLERGENSLHLPWAATNFLNPPFSNIQPFLEKAVCEARSGSLTAAIFPNTPETKYIRYAKKHADTFIEMPFRLKFLKPDGSPFTDTKGRVQSPQFPCAAAIFTKLGLQRNTAFMYYDFRSN